MSGIEINPMRRAILATTFGLLAGFFIGILGPTIFVAASALYSGNRSIATYAAPHCGRAHWSHLDYADEHFSAVIWSELTGEWVPELFAIGVIGALNGALGARNGLRSAARSLWPVCLGPLLLLLYPFVEYIRNPNAGSMTWGGAVVLAYVMTPFAWVAGRVGQEIGVACRRFGDKATC